MLLTKRVARIDVNDFDMGCIRGREKVEQQPTIKRGRRKRELCSTKIVLSQIIIYFIFIFIFISNSIFLELKMGATQVHRDHKKRDTQLCSRRRTQIQKF
jgi:hypothetical protein